MCCDVFITLVFGSNPNRSSSSGKGKETSQMWMQAIVATVPNSSLSMIEEHMK
jgi:hypothetical protein